MSDKEMLFYAIAYRSLTKVAAEISNNSEDQKLFEIIDWLIKQAEKTEKYREALKEIANGGITIADSVGAKITARKALEESK